MPPLFSMRRRWLAAALLAIGLGQSVLGVLGALALTKMLHAIAEKSGQIPASAIMLGLLACQLAALEWLKRIVTEDLGLDVAKDVRLRLLDALLRGSPAGTERRSHGSTMLPFMGDLTALRQWISDGVARGLVGVLIMICLSAWIGLQSPKLGLALLLPLGLSTAAMFWFCRPLHDSAMRQRRLRGLLATVIDDRVSKAITVRAMGGEARELKRIARRIDSLNQISLRRSGHVGGLRAASVLGGRAVAMAGFGFGAILVGAGELNPHQLLGLMSLAGMMAAALSDVARAAELTVPGRIAWQRLRGRILERGAFTQARLAPPPASKRRADSGLVVDALMVQEMARPFSASATDGEIIVLEDGTASQKSDLILTVAGLAEPNDGRVRMDGRPVHSLKASRRRAMIGIASPRVPLLRNGLRANMAYRMRGVMRTSVDQLALELAPVTTDVVSIVRAMAGKPRLLLIDGVDAALSSDQLEVLAAHLKAWPGIVVMTNCTTILTNCATRRWRRTEGGLVDEAVSTTAIVQLYPRS